MIQKILIPVNNGQRYYESHYRFFALAMQAAGIKVEAKAGLRDFEVSFETMIDGRPAVIDYSDHHKVEAVDLCLPIFKSHYSKERHRDLPNVFPFSPISFYDWGEVKPVNYQPAESRRILNAQRPGGAAKDRREAVQAMHRDRYGADLDTEITDQVGFWRRGGDCLVAVCIPGARTDILDRGQLQLMALGVCTISPVLEITLPWWKTLRPGVDYLTCQPDFSNLPEAIEFVRQNPKTAQDIGQSAGEMFKRYLMPTELAEWMQLCLILGAE